MKDSPAMEPIYLESRFQCNQDKTSLQIRFDFAKNDGSQSASLAVERLHDAIAPRTSWLLETHSMEIPCKVLAAFQSNASYLGHEATFQGEVFWEQDHVNWRAALAGIFQRVQWNHGQDSMFLSTAENEQSIRVDNVQVYNGRLLQVDGLVTTESGSTSQLAHWLAAALSPPSAVQAASHMVDTADSSAQLRNAPSAIQR